MEKSDLKKIVLIEIGGFKDNEKYFQIKLNELIGENENELMITIVDCSHQIQYTNEKTNNQVLKTVNATVNHELRNPLNSIVATNEHKSYLYKELQNVLTNKDLSKK